MAKIKTIIKTRVNFTIIEEGEYINVTEEMAQYLCNENLDTEAINKGRKTARIPHAIRTPLIEQVMPHADYTNL